MKNLLLPLVAIAACWPTMIAAQVPQHGASADASQAATAAADAASPEDIVVVGGRQRAAQLARSFSLARDNDALPRWYAPVCVRMIGMEPAAAEHFEQRVRAIAQEAGVPVAEPGCAPNLLVGFTADATPAAERLYRRRPVLFANGRAGERQRFVSGGDPVRWWTVDVVESVFGRQPVGTGAEAGLAVDGSVTPGLNVPVFGGGSGASLIQRTAMLSIRSTAVLIDSPAVEGISLNALADYVAMAAFTGVPMDVDYGTAANDTVMTMFSRTAGQRSAGLTQADRAYLRALYAAPRWQGERDVRGELRAAVRQSLSRQDVEQALRP